MKARSDIKDHHLDKVRNGFICYQTLSDTNNKTMNKTTTLPILRPIIRLIMVFMQALICKGLQPNTRQLNPGIQKC